MTYAFDLIAQLASLAPRPLQAAAFLLGTGLLLSSPCLALAAIGAVLDRKR